MSTPGGRSGTRSRPSDFSPTHYRAEARRRTHTGWPAANVHSRRSAAAPTTQAARPVTRGTGRPGRSECDHRRPAGTPAQRALPRSHPRPPRPGPRRASRRHHAPPIWRVGVEQQYIAAGWTSTRSALLVFPQVGDLGPLPPQLRSHKSDSMIFLPRIPRWQIVSVIIVRCWRSGSRRRRAGTASAGLRSATCWPPSLQ
jgi:hypothetical protein